MNCMANPFILFNDLYAIKSLSRILSSTLEEQLQFKLNPNMKKITKKGSGSFTSSETSSPPFISGNRKGNCNHLQVFRVSEDKLLKLKTLFSSTKAELANLQLQFQSDLKQMVVGRDKLQAKFWDLKNGWTTNIKLLRKLLKSVESYKRAQLALGIGDEDLAREALKRRKSYAITNLSIYCRQKFLSIIATYLYLFTYKGNVLSFYFQHKQWVKNCKYIAIM
ncbi:hypothetical protein L1887_28865 [Cichorium endivia]|nr:hypothetical protein L1887_28865 [Cichorium endivia]